MSSLALDIGASGYDSVPSGSGPTGYTLVCDTATIEVTGVDVGLFINRVLTCGTATIEVTGVDVGLTLTRVWDAMGDVHEAYIADSQYITLNGADVSTWTPQKGNVDLVMATAADQPLWNATGCNGFGSVEGDGTSEHLTGDGNGADASGNDTPFEVIILWKHNTGTITANRYHYAYGNSADSDSRHSSWYSTSSGRLEHNRRGDTDTVNVNAQTTQTYGDSDWHVFSAAFTGTTVTFTVDGASTSVTDAALDRAAMTSNRFTLMALRLNAAASGWNDISLSGVWLASAVLSSGDRDAIVAWAKSRAGIA